MEYSRPNESFLPVLQKEFGEENVFVAKYALGTQPIRNWYKDWKPAHSDTPKAEPHLHDSLIVDVRNVVYLKTLLIHGLTGFCFYTK